MVKLSKTKLRYFFLQSDIIRAYDTTQDKPEGLWCDAQWDIYSTTMSTTRNDEVVHDYRRFHGSFKKSHFFLTVQNKSKRVIHLNHSYVSKRHASVDIMLRWNELRNDMLIETHCVHFMYCFTSITRYLLEHYEMEFIVHNYSPICHLYWMYLTYSRSTDYCFLFVNRFSMTLFKFIPPQ